MYSPPPPQRDPDRAEGPQRPEQPRDVARAGETFHAELPCLKCGYDLRGAPVEAGMITCPECGAKWNERELRESAGKKYISATAVAAWVLGMPVVYAIVASLTCVGMGDIAASGGDGRIESLMSWVILGVFVLIIGLLNRPISGKLVSKGRRLPQKDGVRSGAEYWIGVVSITTLQVVLMFLYPLLCCCGGLVGAYAFGSLPF